MDATLPATYRSGEMPFMPVPIAAPAVVPVTVLPPIAPYDPRGSQPVPFIPPPCTVVPKEADIFFPNDNRWDRGIRTNMGSEYSG